MAKPAAKQPARAAKKPAPAAQKPVAAKKPAGAKKPAAAEQQPAATPPPAASSNIDRRRTAARADGREGYMQRREEILHAAATVFKQRGFRGTALSHVAEALDIDRATLYYYVGSKDELFQEAVTDAVKKNLADAQALQREPGPAPERLRRLMQGVMESYGESYPFLYVLLQENLSHMAPKHSAWAKEIREINRSWERLIVDIVQQGQDEGTIIAGQPAWMIAYGVIGMFGWTNRWFNPGRSEVTAGEIGAAFAEMVLGGIETAPGTA